jgi:opacity protein-like surface antigen
MARIGAPRLAFACAAFGFALSFVRSAAAEHAPPPAIVLEAPPAPELPAAEYARRPFEITPELVLGLPSCAEGNTDNQRCAGIGAGLGAGGALLWRPTPYFAFGGTFNALSFGFHPGQSSALGETRASGHFVGVLGRVYFFERGVVEPYLELGLGSGRVETRANESGAAYDESTSGIAFRTGAGLEFYLDRHVRLGPAFDWTTFNVSQVRRCGAGRCVDLDENEYGHGTGFTSFAIRLSILLGPGL